MLHNLKLTLFDFMKVKCLLVDDEPLAIQLLENHLSNLEGFEIVGTCNNAIRAAEILREIKVDLLFLDIRMPKMTGLDLLRMTKVVPPVIITTAYRAHAMEGYELDIVDYLLKPITFDRFFKAVEKYLRLYRILPVDKAATAPPISVVNIKTGGKYLRLSAEDIRYIESFRDQIVIHNKDGGLVSAKYKISEIEKELDGNIFLRIHRSYIVNIKAITAFNNYLVSVDTTELPVGASYRDFVFSILKNG